MIVREFKAGDEPHLWQVFFSAVHQTAAADYSIEQLHAWAPVDRDLSAWTNKIREIQPFVAERDGQVVGYADVQATGYIDHFFVSPTVARQRVGSLLMRRIHAVAQQRGVPKLFANVSITARPFFEHWGFTVETPQTVVVRGVEFTNYRMHKTLVCKSENQSQPDASARNFCDL